MPTFRHRTTIMTHLLLTLWCIYVSFPAMAADNTQDDAIASVPGMERSMIEVRVAKVVSDHIFPWRNDTPSWHTGYGIAIGNNMFLTPEELIRNHTSIQIRKAGSVQPVPAQVYIADPRVGLALISPQQPDWFPESVPLDTRIDIPQSGDFTIVQWGDNDHTQAAIGNLLSIGFDSIGEGTPEQLTYQLASSLQVKHAGTPVLFDNRLAGIAMSQGANERASVVISPESINRFLDATQQDQYENIPEPDFTILPLADPVRRHYLAVPEKYQNHGVYVESALTNQTTTDGLQPHDVLIKWDGELLDPRGNYEHPKYGSISFRHLFANHKAGDSISATVVRDKQLQDVTVTLHPYNPDAFAIPENAIKAPADYVVEAGFVFRELTWNFLKSFGNKWQRRTDIDLLWRAIAPPAEHNDPEKRTVILVGVLADPINIGYRRLQLHIVKEINQAPIDNIMDLACRIDQEGLHSVTLDGMNGVPITLDTEAIPEANARVQQRFQIPSLRRLTKSAEAAHTYEQPNEKRAE
jgi:hypothetical protein